NTDLAAFVRALLAELAIHQRSLALRPRTMFFGGGTPTMLSESHLASLLQGLRGALDLSHLEEFCLEANPRTISPDKARLLRDSGVNRVSLGVQSWDEAVLRTLGRDHTPDEAAETYDALRHAGMPSVNLDLMFSIPGQTAAIWQGSLEKTVALGPDHISAYNLTYEEDTAFLRQFETGELDKNPDRDADQFFAAHDWLTRSGFEHYEVSNYSRPGHRSMHNEAYWRGADYLGMGPSAFSTVGRHRWKNIPDTAAWMASLDAGRIPVMESEELDDAAWLTERVALELRTAEGLDPAQRSVNQEQSHRLRALGLIAPQTDRIQLTREGLALADTIALDLLT
ncbi:MAG TPA: coproporphyrinogen-III oxidase family protein, partial [Verrucomicrobiaceae bacterium]